MIPKKEHLKQNKMERYKLGELKEQAKQLGATYSRITFVPFTYYTNVLRKEPFIEHFFNDENKEVCLIVLSENLFELTGMTIFEQPRIWDTLLFNNPMIGQPTNLDSCYIQKLINSLN